MVPEAPATVSNASIRGFYKLALRAFDSYSAGVRCVMEEFKQHVRWAKVVKWWANTLPIPYNLGIFDTGAVTQP